MMEKYCTICSRKITSHPPGLAWRWADKKDIQLCHKCYLKIWGLFFDMFSPKSIRDSNEENIAKNTIYRMYKNNPEFFKLFLLTGGE